MHDTEVAVRWRERVHDAISHPRSDDTFMPISEYPYARYRIKRSAREAVVELTVIGGVLNIIEYGEQVSVRRCGASTELLHSL